MRPLVPLALMSLMLVTTPWARAQQAPPQPAAPSPAPPALSAAAEQVLPIPVPANAKISSELDARGEDVLGVLKSFLRGINGQTVSDLADSARAAATIFSQTRPGAKVPAVPAPAPGPPELVDVSLADLFQNINHLHYVTFDLPTGAAHAKKGLAPLPSPGLPPSAALTPNGVVNFYEQTFDQEGGHRIYWSDSDDSRVLMIGFRNPPSFALIEQSAGQVSVARSDGYPTPEALVSLFSTAAKRAVPTTK